MIKEKNTNSSELSKGSLVFLMNMNRRSKYDTPYIGPYIIDKLNQKINRAWLQHAVTKQQLKNPVSIENLKLVQCEVKDLIPYELKEDTEWEVLALLDSRFSSKGTEYLVLWQNWPEPTWEPDYKLTNCQKLLDEYHINNELQQPKPILVN